MERKNDDDFFWYSYGSKDTEINYYGLYVKDIINIFKDKDFVIVIIRDSHTIQAIKKRLKEIRCYSIFVYTDENLVIERLKNDGQSEEEIKFRLSRLPMAWNDYQKYSHLYDETIINSSHKNDFQRLIEKLLENLNNYDNLNLIVDNHNKLPLSKPLVGFKNIMEERLKIYPYNKNIFLMMKFRKNNKILYEFIIKIIESRGYNCVRADNSEWDITRNIYNPIAVSYCCKYGIALFDEPESKNEYSANVAYELGVMHNQLKECLIIRHTKLTAAPFDLVKELYNNYSDNLELEDIIKKWMNKLSRLD
jgi:guanylate kinase